MDIGIPKEIKPQEGRVAMMPTQVQQLVKAGNTVRVETSAGVLSDVSDEEYQKAGAEITPDAARLFKASEMVVKVKEIMPEEYAFLKKDHIIFTNLHTALNRELTDLMLDVGLTGISAEDTHQNGSPNCALAGEVGAFEGLRLTMSPHGGCGRSFMSHYGAPPLKALVIGLGMVGQGALRTLLRLGVHVTGYDINQGARYKSLLQFDNMPFEAKDISELHEDLAGADLIVNCVLWPKHRDDHLIDRTTLKTLKKTAVIADISCDTAGAIETTRSTTWAEPTYREEGILHFCVDNVPGAVAVTASTGYANSILPFTRLVAEVGAIEACRREAWLAKGLTTHKGTLILKETGVVQERDYVPVNDYLNKN